MNKLTLKQGAILLLILMLTFVAGELCAIQYGHKAIAALLGVSWPGVLVLVAFAIKSEELNLSNQGQAQ